jgi:hypothetical protein
MHRAQKENTCIKKRQTDRQTERQKDKTETDIQKTDRDRQTERHAENEKQ